MSNPPSSLAAGSVYRNVIFVAAALLALDGLLLGLHCVHVMDKSLLGRFFSIEEDRGLAEFFQYFKELVIVLLICISAFKLDMKSLFAWAALFLYIFVDDAFAVHETLGHRLAESWQFAPEHLKPSDVGELLVSAAAGGLLFSGIGLGYWLGGPRFRSITHDLLLLFAGLAFFGVAVDMLHSLIRMGGQVAHVLAFIEDGGEMFVMSLMLAYAWAIRVVPEERRFHIVDAGWRFLRRRFF